MANVSKMSTTNAPEAATAPASAFFKMLPPEIRLKIYKMAFHGATADAVLTMEDEPSGGGKTHLVRFRHSKHFDLLRSCRKIYDEAMPTYWSETPLNLVQLWTIAISTTKSSLWLNDVDYTADDYSYHLCRSLPEAAKANVKHVRGMMLPPLYGSFVKKNPQLTATAMLSNFKRLATCDISPTVRYHPEIDPIRTNICPKITIDFGPETNNENDTESTLESTTGSIAEGNAEGNAESIAGDNLIFPLTRDRGGFKTLWEREYCEPKDLLRKICGIDATAGVVFLVKKDIELVTMEFVRGDHAAAASSNLIALVGTSDDPWSIQTRSYTVVSCEHRHKN